MSNHRLLPISVISIVCTVTTLFSLDILAQDPINYSSVYGGITCHVRNTASEASKKVKRINGSLVNKHKTNPFRVSCPILVSIPHPQYVSFDGPPPQIINVGVWISVSGPGTFTCRFFMGNEEMGVARSSPDGPGGLSFGYDDISWAELFLLQRSLTAVCQLPPLSSIDGLTVTTAIDDE